MTELWFSLSTPRKECENYRKLVESEDQSTRTFGHNLLHFIYKGQGRFGNAEREAAGLIEIAESAGQPLWKNFSLWALITMDMNTGDFIKAKEIVDREIDRFKEETSPPDFNWIFYKTWLAARRKSFDEAKKALGELGFDPVFPNALESYPFDEGVKIGFDRVLAN